MARELKDSLQSELQTDTTEALGDVFKDPNSIQIETNEQLENTLVRIIKDDYESARQAKMKRDYGEDSKGGKYNFNSWFKELKDLYMARRESKTVPWRFCSNRSLRIAASILDMLHARLFPAIVNEDLLEWRAGESTDHPKVERISKLMHWWIWVNSRMRSFFDVWMKTTIAFGESLVESCWKIDYSDSGKTTEVPITDEMGNEIGKKQETYLDIKEMTNSKVFLPDQYYLQESSTDINKEPVVIEDSFLYRELEQMEQEGKFKNIRNILREKIPFDKDTVSSLSPDEQEAIRDIKIRNHKVDVLIWYGNYDANKDGYPENVRMVICPKYDLYISGVSVKDLTKSGKRPIKFSKYDSRIDRPLENWGEGVLEKIKELAQEVDAIFNQLTDSNTLSIMRPGFFDPGGDLDAPALTLQPNRWTAVPDPQRNIYVPDLQINIERLIAAIRLVLEFIERLTAASSYVLGKESEIVGGSGTATRTNAIVQSAEQRFALPAERLREAASNIIRDHLDLLQLNIPTGLESRILGENGQPIFDENELTQLGISGEFDAYLLPDPSMGSKQTERDLASMFYSLLLENVIVGTDPAKIYKITADLIKAYGKDPKEYLGPEPDWDMVDSPEDENTLIVQGDFSRVKANITENHLLHIQKHQDLLNSPSLLQLQQMSPHLYEQVVMVMQSHIQEHMMMLQVMQSIVQKFGGKNGNNPQESERGGDDRGGKEPSGSNQPSRMETTNGPLASAMQSKREGESGIPQV